MCEVRGVKANLPARATRGALLKTSAALTTRVYFRRAKTLPVFQAIPEGFEAANLIVRYLLPQMPLLRVTDITDPRLAPYREMKDRDLARHGPLFIAEGWQVVQRLLASDFPCESILTSSKRADEVAAMAPPEVTVYVADAEVLDQVIGFKFHQGVLACGRRKPSPTLEDVCAARRRLTLVVCPEIANTENLGMLIRIAAGFGADAMVLGERSCSPFYRQSVRVSMGTIFSLPIVESKDILSDLRRLREEFGVETVATVLDESAEPLENAGRADKLALLFGNEAQGLSPEIVAKCDRRVTIPMKHGTDSLNVYVAAGIFLYHFTRGERAQT
jgi:tRNA G18 (ribose-2'-O)-methylase SpoU